MRQVLGVLDADRDAQHRGRHAHLVQALGRHVGVRHRRRVLHEALGAAEAHREPHEVQVVEQPERLGLAPVDLEREGRPRRLALRW
jgi:hypothetical protein